MICCKGGDAKKIYKPNDVIKKHELHFLCYALLLHWKHQMLILISFDDFLMVAVEKNNYGAFALHMAMQLDC